MNTKNLVKLTLCVFFLILATFLYKVSYDYIEPRFNDYFVKKQVTKASEDIVLVVIDDKSLQKLRWPWSREYYAEMFDFLENTANAKVILFDAVLSSPDPYSVNSDTKFYNYLKTTKKLIAGFDLCEKPSTDKINNDCSIPEYLNKEFDKKFDLKIENSTSFIKNHDSFGGVASMPEGFVKNINRLGAVVENRDLDRTIRIYNHLVYVNGKYYPSLALAGYSLVTGDKEYILTKNSLVSKKSGLKIPLPSGAYNQKRVFSYLRWYKPVDSDSFYSHKEYSAVDVLYSSRAIKSGQKPILDPDVFKDKIVFVGGNASAQALKDKISTPVSQDHAGVDIQATALNNYLDNTYTIMAEYKTNLLITCIILLISFLIICYVPPIAALALNFGLLLVYFTIYCQCINRHHVINFISVFLLEILLIAFAYIYQFFIEGEKKTMMQQAVGKYLSADVMQQVVKDGDKITLGGKRTEATVMFIDIRRFTSISENMSANEVSLLLNEYFTTIYPIITKYNGTLNKFIGDAVLVIFTDEKQDKTNHAQNAILCADKVLQEVKRLQQKWLHEGKPRIDVGVGINSGEVFLGNIGTQERMEYTVIGDTVNTASRIEGYNKMYKTKFLIGENTFELVKSYVDVIKINQVAIRGKTQKVNIYEVLRIRK